MSLNIYVHETVEEYMCREPLDVRLKWKRILIEEINRRNNVVSPDSHYVAQNPQIYLMMKRLDAHICSELRKEVDIIRPRYDKLCL